MDKSAGLGSWLFCLLISFCLLSCKKKPYELNKSAYIIGEDDIALLSIDQVDDVVEVVRKSSVLLVTKLRSGQLKFCSGNLISLSAAGASNNDFPYVTTNFHCFAVIDEETKLATDALLPEACVNTEVVFGFSEAESFKTSFRDCDVDSLRTFYEADLAAFRLTEPLPSGYRSLALSVERPEDLVGRKAVIVHHPDKEENRALLKSKGYLVPKAAVTKNNCQVLGRFSPQEEQLDEILTLGFKHSCDLINGSSGSSLVDVLTREVIGVNWGGITIDYQDGPRVTNVATEAAVVRDFLLGKSQVEVKRVAQQRASAALTTVQQKQQSAQGGRDKGTRGGCGVVRYAHDSAQPEPHKGGTPSSTEPAPKRPDGWLSAMMWLLIFTPAAFPWIRARI